MRLGLDTFGGDFAPDSTILGAIEARRELPGTVDIVLIGNEKASREKILSEGDNPDDFEFIHTTDFIEMGEHPAKAFKSKPKSSTGLGFHYLKKGELDSFASAGNSGAMMVGSMFTIQAIPGVIRPSVTSAIPCPDGSMNILLDVGINADCKPDVLYQFGILGSIYAKEVFAIENPKVGLLSMGEEEEKGTMQVQAAHQLMKDSQDFNFFGNVEGRDLFSGEVDVIVTDGFTGNVMLKEAEAFYAMIKKRGIDDAFFNRLNYEIYGGTPVLGVNGNVIIGHGISSARAIKNMILHSLDVSKAQLAEKIKNAFQ
ncbi:MAG: phosphate--acyl-ACP acyltransferase [Crocinitomicaceae bacterium]|nr:phosphate--acyl-ACP acyltransferase [Crocinitomicaceae bacterium]|tara:strand:- start:54367 stop:55305 length:939 start_codon:yes stop_codon:yes gene_type:complete